MRSLGIVFPGQGSQTVGMLSDIAEAYPQIKDIFHAASQVLNYDLWRLVQAGPADVLDQTAHTQPALLASSYAIWQLISTQTSFQPRALAGHSLGEYTALVCAEAISFPDAIQLVAARGQFMQEAAPAGLGALAAIIGLDDEKVAEICQNVCGENEVLTPANFNSPGQVVIAGHKAAVERAVIVAKEAGARLAKQLPVSVPSHCALMQPAAEKLKQLLTTISIKTPIFPVLNNVDVIAYAGPDEIRDGLVRQLYRPVRWVETIKKFRQLHVTHLIECGPGKVLTGLNKRIEPEIALSHTADLTNLHNFLESTHTQDK